MSVKLTVLGCWGLATIGETSSFLIEAPEGNFLLDFCPGVARQLKRVDFDLTTLTAAFASHVHADHLSGAPYLIFQQSVERRQAPGPVPDETIFLGNSTVARSLRQIMELYYPDRQFPIDFRDITYSPSIEIANGSVRFSFAPTNHTAPCHSVRIDFLRSGKSIAYTSDGLFDEGTIALCKGANLLIGEAFGTMSDYKGVYLGVKHSLGVHLGELARNAGVSNILPFHMHPRYGQVDEKRNELLGEIRSSYSGQIHWPGDLTTLEV
jgi:ribonuclease BN (tRNA processing enzyme)